MLEILKLLHDRLFALSQDFFGERKRPIVALYSSLIQFTGSMVLLVENPRGHIAVPSVLRSFLEAYVELRNLLNDSDYIDNMSAQFCEQQIKVLKEAREGNRYSLALIGDSRAKDLDVEIENYENQLKELEAKKRKPLNVKERFQRAELLQEYKSLYAWLSCDVHCNPSALMRRHVGPDSKVVYYKEDQTPEYIDWQLAWTAEMLLDASAKIHTAFESGKIGEVEAMRRQLLGALAWYSNYV